MKKNHKIVIVVLSVILVISCCGLGFIMAYGKDSDFQSNKEEKLSLTCDKKSIQVDEEVLCSLTAETSNYEVSAVSSVLEESNDFELIEIIPDSSWEGDGEEGDIDLYTDINKTGKFNILKFKISLKSENIEKIQINLVENSFFDEEYEEHKLKDITTTLGVKK